MATNSDTEVHVEIEDLGGIENRTETIRPGINILSGANATNRTSFLEALATGLGGNLSSVRSGQSEGSVTIEIDGEEYTRTVERRNGRSVPRGDGYLDDAKDAELFAWLLTNNEIRQAIRTQDGHDLRELAMEPVDTEQIEDQKEQLKQKRDQLDTDIKEVERQKERIPSIQSNIESLKAEKVEIQEQIEETEAAIEEAEKSETQAEAEDEREAELKELNQKRLDLQNDIDDAEYRLERKQNSLETSRENLESVEERLEAAREEKADLDIDRDEVEEQRRELESEKDEIEATISALDEVINFNQEMLRGEKEEIRELLQTDQGGSGVEKLDEQITGEGVDESTQVECWTCGSRTQVSDIDGQITFLLNQRKELQNEVDDLDEKTAELRDRRDRFDQVTEKVKEAKQQKRRLEDDIETYEEQIESIKQSLETKQEELESIDAEVDELEEEIREESESEILDLRQERRQLETDLEHKKREIKHENEELESAEAEAERLEELEEKREEVSDELTALRTKIEDLEQEVVDTFNDKMEELIDILAYENLERVWINKRTPGGSDSETIFDLNIVRDVDGSGLDDTVDNLSESEREVVSIAFALSGYLAHDIHEQMPFLLFDSVEMIDGDRLNQLFHYFEDTSDYIVAALLEDDARSVESGSTSTLDFGQAMIADD